VLASGCGAVSVFIADPKTAPAATSAPALPSLDQTRALFKQLFERGERYKTTGGIHAAGLTDGTALLHHAEDIGRHNAVDKVIGGALLAGRPIPGLGLLVTGRISGELAFKAARAGVSYVATPSVPSSIAVDIAARSGMVLIGRAVSGQPQMHVPAR
jgi:FdhD protein